MLCRKHGVKLCYTPMLHARLFQEDKRYSKEKFTTCKEDRPLVVQICGDNAEIMLKTAKLLQDKCDAIDINLGCPQNIARRGNYGAYLLEQEERVGHIVKSLSDGLDIPVTCKIRIYKDLDRTLKMCKYLESMGCKALTVHGRTKEENKTVKKANWDIIQKIKSELSIPVIANGSISNLEDVKNCLEITKCDAVMSSEAILENPALFNEDYKVLPTQFELARDYLALTKKYPGSTHKMKRTHLFRFLHGPIGYHPEFRQRFGKAREGEFEKLVEQLAEVHSKQENNIASIILPKKGTGNWYLRHRVPSMEKKRRLEMLEKEKAEKEITVKKQKLEAVV